MCVCVVRNTISTVFFLFFITLDCITENIDEVNGTERVYERTSSLWWLRVGTLLLAKIFGAYHMHIIAYQYPIPPRVVL